MANKMNLDAFTDCRVTLNGVEHKFRPASLGDLIHYFDGEILPQMREATTQKEIYDIKSSVIKKYIPNLTDEDINSMTPIQFHNLYLYIQNGTPPDEENEKNS